VVGDVGGLRPELVCSMSKTLKSQSRKKKQSVNPSCPRLPKKSIRLHCRHSSCLDHLKPLRLRLGLPSMEPEVTNATLPCEPALQVVTPSPLNLASSTCRRNKTRLSGDKKLRSGSILKRRFFGFFMSLFLRRRLENFEERSVFYIQQQEAASWDLCSDWRMVQR